MPSLILLILFQCAKMEPMVRSVHRAVHQTVRINHVTSLQQMECVLAWSVKQDIKGAIVPYVIIT